MRCGNFWDSAKVRKLTLSKKKIITYCHLKHYENSSWEDKGYMLNLLPIKKKQQHQHTITYIPVCHTCMQAILNNALIETAKYAKYILSRLCCLVVSRVKPLHSQTKLAWVYVPLNKTVGDKH